jgi:hypothetical protein
MRERRDAYTVLMGKLEGKRQLAAPGHRWENIMKLDFKEIHSGCGLHTSGSSCDQVGGSKVWGIS